MKHPNVIWIDGPDGNVAHLAEHGVDPDEAEEVLRHPLAVDFSRTADARWLLG
ncbi:MAG: hypothetical protein IT440_02480 [Phycisphaeraceae bacterium]|nr:hypothetical protein [Phycisphaeraceae bacterium]